MLGTWDTARLNIYAYDRVAFNTTAGTLFYTMGSAGGGSGGTTNLVRPVSIRKAFNVTTPDDFEIPIKLATVDEITQPDFFRQASIVELLYYDAQYPTAGVSLYPIPATNASIVMYVWQQLPQFALLTTGFDMPPGYENAIILNLAVRVASMFGIQPSPALIGEAQAAYESMRGLNAPPIPGAAEEAQASQPPPGPANTQ